MGPIYCLDLCNDFCVMTLVEVRTVVLFYFKELYFTDNWLDMEANSSKTLSIGTHPSTMLIVLLIQGLRKQLDQHFSWPIKLYNFKVLSVIIYCGSNRKLALTPFFPTSGKFNHLLLCVTCVLSSWTYYFIRLYNFRKIPISFLN